MPVAAKPKFDTEDRSFVHVGTYGGKIGMITEVRPGPINRYDLRWIDGSTIGNVGEYELTLASDKEIEAALEAARKP